MIQRFVRGFSFMLIARQMLRLVPTIKYWLLTPLLIQSVILGVGLYFGVTELKVVAAHAVSWVVKDPATMLGAALYGVLYFLSLLIFAVLFFYVLNILASIINLPFYTLLSEKILTYYQVLPEGRTIKEMIMQSSRMLKVGVVRGILLLGLGVILFIFSFLPGLNIFTAFVVFYILACDSVDYAFEAMGFSLSKRWIWIRSQTPEFLGMSTFIALTALVPGLILIVMPMAVIFSSALLAQDLKSKKVTSK